LDNKKEGSAYKIINGVIMGRLASACWFTNIDHGKRHEMMQLDTMAHNLKFNKKLRRKLESSYGTTDYPKYDNYDAIEIPFTECIPSDYSGIMGVPITFLDRYCPEQFEIIWQASGNAYANAPRDALEELKFDPTIKYGGGLGAPVINGSATYARIMIRRKQT
ncbi:MAG: DNA methyltransferase, partial [Clostridia bacterium]|nr:DNA methyltransferase [Clostridia bacterium]